MRSVLITGGAGFFGQGMARRLIASDEISRVAIYSRNEWNQAVMAEDFGHDPKLRCLIGDVRDYERLMVAMRGVDLVIHASALKRVQVGEYNPTEMCRTNIDGAINVIQAARAAGVLAVVALSSDKAAEPLNCYGATKLVSEKLFLAANNTQGPAGPAFSVARYGNVAGSTGSIIPIWRRRMQQDLPLIITNKDCTRYWMTRDQAVDMVLWCAGRTGIHVPNLKAYRVADLAEALAPGHPVKEIGLTPGEKLHETMVSAGEIHAFNLFHPPGTDIKRTEAMTSENAPRMTVNEIREALQHV